MTTETTRRPPRWRVTAWRRNWCYYCETDQDGLNLDLSAPATGGYVRDGSGRQVCQELELRGDTLHWDPALGPLAALIRREARRRWRRIDREHRKAREPYNAGE